MANHIKADQNTKLISTYAVSNAAVHDAMELKTLIDKDDAGQKLYADSAYIGQGDSIAWCKTTSGKSNSRKANDKKPESRQQEEVTGFVPEENTCLVT